MGIYRFLLAAAMLISIEPAVAYTPSPDTQKVLITFVWVTKAEEQCQALNGMHLNIDKMTALFHSVGLRWGDLERQIGEPIKGEPEGTVPNPGLQRWMSTLFDKVQDQLEINSTEEERSRGATHDVKGFCERMWKEFGPGSVLQLLQK